jgi:hypothetical protein
MIWVLTVSCGLLGYAYAGYPTLMWLWSRLRGREVRKGAFDGGVSVLIAAHNEAGTLPGKIGNLLELAKTEPIREIWVGLDGCSDGTAEVVRGQRSAVSGQRSDGEPAPATCNLQPRSTFWNLRPGGARRRC